MKGIANVENHDKRRLFSLGNLLINSFMIDLERFMRQILLKNRNRLLFKLQGANCFLMIINIDPDAILHTLIVLKSKLIFYYQGCGQIGNKIILKLVIH